MSQESAVREKSGLRSGFPEWLYLGFLLFLFLGPVFNPDVEAIDWAVATVTALVCAIIFMIAIRHRKFRAPAAAGMLAVGAVSTLLGTAAMGVVPTMPLRSSPDSDRAGPWSGGSGSSPCSRS